MHVLSIITAQETDLNAKIFSGPCNTLEGQAAMPRSMREPSITAVGPMRDWLKWKSKPLDP